MRTDEPADRHDEANICFQNIVKEPKKCGESVTPQCSYYYINELNLCKENDH